MQNLYLRLANIIAILGVVVYVLGTVQTYVPNIPLMIIPAAHGLIWIMIGLLMRIDSAVRSV